MDVDILDKIYNARKNNREVSQETDMNIAICDDCQEDRNQLVSNLRDYAGAQCLDFVIDEFESVFMLQCGLKRKEYDVLFLDIYIGEDSGVEFAKNNRSLITGDLIFTTSSKNFAIDAFKMRALNYVVKPVSYADVAECFNRMEHIPDQLIEVKCGYKNIKIPEKSIEYIESFNNVVTIHTKQQDFQTYENLSSIYALLNHKIFIRPYRSYIVNMEQIDLCKNNLITLKNQVEIQISRKNKKEVMDQYNQFLFDKMRE